MIKRYIRRGAYRIARELGYVPEQKVRDMRNEANSAERVFRQALPKLLNGVGEDPEATRFYRDYCRALEKIGY